VCPPCRRRGRVRFADHAPPSAVLVHWFVFRLALRQEAIKWSREKRAEVYTDALTEAKAEQEWVDWQRALAQRVPAEDLSREPDHRRESLERKRLGAPRAAYGREVNGAPQRLHGVVVGCLAAYRSVRPSWSGRSGTMGWPSSPTCHTECWRAGHSPVTGSRSNRPWPSTAPVVAPARRPQPWPPARSRTMAYDRPESLAAEWHSRGRRARVRRRSP
jgi:hypothetical protein